MVEEPQGPKTLAQGRRAGGQQRRWPGVVVGCTQRVLGEKKSGLGVVVGAQKERREAGAESREN